MPIAQQDIFESSPNTFDNFDLECNYGSPPSGTFDSQGWNPAVPNAAEDGGQDSCALESSATPLTYNVIWKLQLRKGRMITLTGDTVEDIHDRPAAFWNDHLQNELLDVVTEKVPDPQYKPDETKITVSTSKRAQRCLEKRFRALNIDWSPVENKLSSWSDQGNNLTVEIWFIYKEVQTDSTNKVGKTGRGATKQQLAARDKLVAQQEASGVRPVWKDVSALFECSSAVCPNRGFSCWRDPETKKHHKLDSDTMDKLIDFAEEGHKLETHGDVPDRIREVIYKHEEEDAERKRQKRKASDPLQNSIRICCHGSHSGSCHDSDANTSKVARVAKADILRLPMPVNKAPELLCEWLCNQVTNERWQSAYQLAGKITVDNGYHLGRMYESQAFYADLLVKGGVLLGIADQFVSRIREWLDSLCPE